jgi:biotin carboxylase
MTRQPGLLILCGGSEAVPAIQRARCLGFRTVVVDGNASAPGRNISDEFVRASVYDHNEVIDALKPVWPSLGVDAVTTVAADNSLTVARVGQCFGLRAQSVTTAFLATNKLAMKDALRSAKIPIPWYREITSLAQLEEQLGRRPGAYVLKPVDSRGSRGVTRLSSISECGEAYRNARSATRVDQLILEEWLDGDQLSSESLVWDSRSYLCGLADRNYKRLNQLYPYVVEDGGETPSQFFNTDMVQAVDQLMDDVCKAIGLTEGSIKGDLVLIDGRLVVIEVASRLSGGSFSTVTIPLVHRYDLVGNVFRVAIGQTPTLPPRPLTTFCFQANRFLFPAVGTVRAIERAPLVSSNVVDSVISVRVGDRLKAPRDHTLRGGWVLTAGASRIEAVNEAEKFVAATRIIVEPDEISA